MRNLINTRFVDLVRSLTSTEKILLKTSKGDIRVIILGLSTTLEKDDTFEITCTHKSKDFVKRYTGIIAKDTGTGWIQSIGAHGSKPVNHSYSD